MAGFCSGPTTPENKKKPGRVGRPPAPPDIPGFKLADLGYLRQAHEAVGVARGVRVEADDVALVVHAVDRSGAGPWVVDGRELAVRPGKAVRHRVVAAAGGVHADDLAPVVNAGRLRRRRAG